MECLRQDASLRADQAERLGGAASPLTFGPDLRLAGPMQEGAEVAARRALECYRYQNQRPFVDVARRPSDLAGSTRGSSDVDRNVISARPHTAPDSATADHGHAMSGRRSCSPRQRPRRHGVAQHAAPAPSGIHSLLGLRETSPRGLRRSTPSSTITPPTSIPVIDDGSNASPMDVPFLRRHRRPGSYTSMGFFATLSNAQAQVAASFAPSPTCQPRSSAYVKTTVSKSRPCTLPPITVTKSSTPTGVNTRMYAFIALTP